MLEKKILKHKIQDKGKKFIMWTLVTISTIIIFIFWITNLEKTLSINAEARNQNNSNQELQKTKQEFMQALDKIKNDYSESKNSLEKTRENILNQAILKQLESSSSIENNL